MAYGGHCTRSCSAKPRYGILKRGMRAVYCGDHKKTGMVNLREARRSQANSSRRCVSDVPPTEADRMAQMPYRVGILEAGSKASTSTSVSRLGLAG